MWPCEVVALNIKGFAPFSITKAVEGNHRVYRNTRDSEYETNSMLLANDDLLGVVG